MANFILILLGSLALCWAIAMLIQASLQWLAHNPLFLVGLLIGAIITAFCFIKFRRRKYSWARHYHAPIQEPSKEDVKPIVQHIAPQSESDNDDLYSALTRLGYSRIETKEAIEIISKEKPKASLEEKVRAGIEILSQNMVK